MTILSRLTIATALLAAHANATSAEPLATLQLDATEVRPPGSVPPAPVDPPRPRDPIATTKRWGGGVRLTGLSGIGALPGVNYGGELAGHLRHDELFVELALGRWKPERTYVMTDERVELGLDVWTLRGGWASMRMPLRGWLLVEAGELASARGMPGVVTRMMTGETPNERRWQALGAGFGVAWPMTDRARLVGMIEIAVPVNRGTIALDDFGTYTPDPMAARSSVGLELGWR